MASYRALAALLLVACVKAAPLAISITVSAAPSPAYTTGVFGVNVGHAWDQSWQMYMRRLGVAGA